VIFQISFQFSIINRTLVRYL